MEAIGLRNSGRVNRTSLIVDTALVLIVDIIGRFQFLYTVRSVLILCWGYYYDINYQRFYKGNYNGNFAIITIHDANNEGSNGTERK